MIVLKQIFHEVGPKQSLGKKWSMTSKRLRSTALRGVWDEFIHNLDVRAASGGHIKQLPNGVQLGLHNLLDLLFLAKLL